MIAPPIPLDESERLHALASYEILDTPRDASFDGLAALTAHILEMPIALVSIVDESRQWFKAGFGLDATETPRAVSFCGHVVAENAPLVVGDALLDERFRDNPLVTGAPNVRFYAGTPLRTPDGHVLGTLCAIDRRPRELSARQLELLTLLGQQVTDQLERHRQHRLLAEHQAKHRRSERRLRAVLETMVEGVVVQDRTGAITTSNVAAERILGLTADQMMGRTSIDPRWRSIHVDGSPFPGETHPAMVTLATGEPLTDVMMGVHKVGGQLSWISVNSRLLEDPEGGRPVSVLSTFHDVTSRVLAERTLALERAFLSTLLSNLPGSYIAVFDREGVVERVFGHEKFSRTNGDEFCGRHVSNIGSDSQRASMIEAAAGAIGGQAVQVGAAPGSKQWEFVFVPLPDVVDADRRGLAIAHDVSERNQLRDRLTRQDRLVTTGTLAAGVGHEINNPLSYIIVNLDLAIEDLRALGGGSPSGRIHDLVLALGEAREGAERIRKIVRGLRTFAREDSAPVPTDLCAAVELSINMSMHELRQKAEVVTEFEPTPLVMGDESRVSQVLVNLLVNAAHAFPRAEPSINRVLVRTGIMPDGRVSIEVIDNGPGIPAEILPRIFDPFFTTKPVGRGTGLGLSISHNLVSALGGELLVRTCVGEGTTFQVLLPVATLAPPSEHPSAERATEGRGRVLVVDDEPNIVAMMLRLLGGEHDLVTTTDPREAAGLLNEDARFDVIFCDLMMPHVSGVQFFMQVRKTHPELAERIVFMTGGLLQDPVLRDFLDTVPNERIEKPFDIATVRAVTRRYVRYRLRA